MFMVFSKEKIVSYLISLSTVAILFFISFAITKKNNEILRTSTNVVESNMVETNIVETNIVETNTVETDIIETNSNNELIEQKENFINQNE